MMAIVLCGRNPHPQVLSSGLQALLDVELFCKAETFKTTLPEVLQVPGTTQYGGGGWGVETEPWPRLTDGRNMCGDVSPL